MGQQTTDGTWIAGTSDGNWAIFNATDTQITVTNVDGLSLPNPKPFSVTPNAPWPGLVTTPAGGVGFLAGNGVYVLETANGYAELGVKLH